MPASAPQAGVDGGTRRSAVVAALVALACGVLGFAVGSASGVDLDGPRADGARRGEVRGLAIGSREGRIAGEREGRRAGYDGAYGRAYVESFERGALSVDRDSGRRALFAAYEKCGRDRVPIGRAEECGPR